MRALAGIFAYMAIVLIAVIMMISELMKNRKKKQGHT